MQQEQSKECFEHHMLLKEEVGRINHFLFGCPEKGDEVSFVSKVALMFDTLNLIKRLIIGSAVTVLGVGIFVGQKLQEIDNNSKVLEAQVEYVKQIDIRVTKLEEKHNAANFILK